MESTAVPNLSTGLVLTWQIAATEAVAARHEFIEPVHLLIGVCKVGTLAEMNVQDLNPRHREAVDLKGEVGPVVAHFKKANVDHVELYREARNSFGMGDSKEENRSKISRSPASKAAFARAAQLAAGMPVVATVHLLAAILEDKDGFVVEMLKKRGVNCEAFRVAILRREMPVEASQMARWLLDNLEQKLKATDIGVRVSNAAVFALRDIAAQQLENEIGTRMARGEVKPGHIVVIDAQGGELSFQIEGVPTDRP
jgi:ATP-dependent Clp protease ATP-binding subunit ClpA